MQPVLTTTYLLAFPSIMARFIFASPFWENVKEILNPGTSVGAKPWVYYGIYAFFVFLFNIFDIANLPKEIADYMTKMGARIPNIKPGKLTIEYLTKIQASTRFWGGLLLSILATSSTLLDHYLRRINEGFALGFTSVLIIVGSIIELRRSYQAYNVMPSLSKVLRRYGKRMAENICLFVDTGDSKTTYEEVEDDRLAGSIKKRLEDNRLAGSIKKDLQSALLKTERMGIKAVSVSKCFEVISKGDIFNDFNLYDSVGAFSDIT
ncbi:uncharacterized protein A4U43_C08F25770 [Asparagus officinalis]|nr:uncharacterized protein A4U43_C08F25770 [Asparagus officinalis]